MVASDPSVPLQLGHLAIAAGEAFALRVCASQAGFYIGTHDSSGAPFSRESVEYWPTPVAAQQAFATGAWTQRLVP